MIEWHADFIAPWWIVPLYIGCVALLCAATYGAFAVIDRWWRK